MLFDPASVIHAVSGITPVKATGILADQFHTALSSIEVQFLVAPLLTLAEQVQLPLREEPGFSWSWLEQGRDGWDEISSIGVVRYLTFLKVFGELKATAIWAELLSKKWLVELDPAGKSVAVIPREQRSVNPALMSAAVTPRDQRAETLDPQFTTDRITIEALLLRASIGPVEERATFTGPAAIREGWLKLGPLPESDNT